jgi:deazaflavin-dependent oxidoreductase (nitroreductase family)
MINSRPLIRWMSRTHVRLYRATGGWIGGRVGRAEVLLLTTVGRSSGQPRTTPLIFCRDHDSLAVCASNAGDEAQPKWWQNLQADQNATVELGSQKMRVRARVATAEEQQALWRLMVGIYPPYAQYQQRTRRKLVIVVLTPREGVT